MRANQGNVLLTVESQKRFQNPPHFLSLILSIPAMIFAVHQYIIS